MTINSNQDDNALARAIEETERDAWLDLFASARDVYGPQNQQTFEQIGSVGLLANRSVPIAEMNRAFCLGLNSPLTEEALNDVVAWLDCHAADWVIQVSPLVRPPNVEEWFAQHELQEMGTGWAKFHRTLAVAPTPQFPSSLQIRPADAASAQDFGHVVQAGFGLPSHTAAWFSSLPGRRGWHCYLAFDADRPVGAASMYLNKGWGWFGIDTTLAEARGKGVQSALIARRIHDGISHNVSGFTAETANPSERNASDYTSYRNYQRAGFAVGYVRQHYGRQK